uniref:intelectin-1-like n=1 Tax=Styela clava TaxID=7725 RepID=UPI00193A123A|nr:intelectin-1-like [Styela clava]
MTNHFIVDGSPSNILMGYMLLTSIPEKNITLLQLNEVANNILETVSNLRSLFNEKSENSGLVTPVIFDKGNTSEILQMIPPNYRNSVEPGYLQFRAYNSTGYPNALCPGIKMISYYSQQLCIGGVSEDVSQYGTCGDFAGWAGKKTDVIYSDVAIGNAHSQKDISSAILIFYR